MASVRFRNGHFVVELTRSPTYLMEMDDTHPTVTGHGTFSKAIGYRRYGSMLIDWFCDSAGSVQELCVKDAILYVQLKGWDSDTIPSIPSIIHHPPDCLANTPESVLSQYGIVSVSEASQCDCGGTKCKLPCRDWCSTRRNK